MKHKKYLILVARRGSGNVDGLSHKSQRLQKPSPENNEQEKKIVSHLYKVSLLLYVNRKAYIYYGAIIQFRYFRYFMAFVSPSLLEQAVHPVVNARIAPNPQPTNPRCGFK